MNLDVLFINPGNSKAIYQDLSKDYSAIETPIWAGLLENNAAINGWRSDIVDCEANHYSLDESISAIIEHNSLSTKPNHSFSAVEVTVASSKNPKGGSTARVRKVRGPSKSGSKVFLDVWEVDRYRLEPSGSWAK